jgi:acyl-coenzyme A synthetase/AMP-(fatty) acid ligase
VRSVKHPITATKVPGAYLYTRQIEPFLVQRPAMLPYEIQEDHEAYGYGGLALRPGWPSMMRAYLNEDERYRKCFTGGWYLTGDLAMRDAEGYYWFVCRADDAIKSAGHLIGPWKAHFWNMRQLPSPGWSVSLTRLQERW